MSCVPIYCKKINAMYTSKLLLTTKLMVVVRCNDIESSVLKEKERKRALRQ